MIGIIDYNVGNLQSVVNAFDKINSKAQVVSDPEKLKNFDKIILPGVGAFGDAMSALEKHGMKDAILEFAKSAKPLLGICLGMQLLLDSSDEFGFTKGLGLIEGNVKEFDKSKFEHKLKVPHMGWNELFIQKKSPLFTDLPKEIYLYFVHSFHVACKQEFIIGKTYYGYEFPSAIQKDNIYGFQPHPEKSHEYGLKILKNFTKV